MSECKHERITCVGHVNIWRCDDCGHEEPNIEELRAKVVKVEQERDELQAQVAVLRGALETATDYLYNPFEPDNQCAQYKNIKNILQTTPAEAAERVQKLVEVEQAAREYVSVSNLKMSIWIGSSDSLQEEKLNKLVALSKALDAIETEAR